MKCKNCGGNIRFEHGLGICESCGSEYKLESAFENVDVYICYVENDLQDRRTRDSMIAQDVYQRLEGANINTFYERFSAANLTDEKLEMSSYQAFYHARIILILATTPQNFEKLLSDYRDMLDNKQIIPVYAEMDAYDIPKELSKYQALNYDSVGSITDLIKNALRILGRAEEADVLNIAKTSAKKKKAIMITVILAFFAVLLGAGAYIAFGTSLIFPEKGQISEEDKSTQYSIAQELQEKGKYAEAISIFYGLGDYKDSYNKLTKLYANYEGYYQSDDGLVSLYLNIENNAKATIELEKKSDGKVVKVNESAEIQGTAVSFEFVDSQANQGTAAIELQNQSISLNTIITVNNDDLSIGELNESFEIAKRSDKPLNGGLTKDTLVKWVSEKTTLDDIKQMGYEVEYEDCLYGPNDHKYDETSIYTIKNTNIKLLLLGYDISRATDEMQSGMEYLLDEAIVVALIAPAETLTPQKLGNDFTSFVEGDLLYVPDSVNFTSFNGADPFAFINNWKEKIDSCESVNEEIESQTLIGVTSREIIGNSRFNMLQRYNNIDLAARAANQYLKTHSIDSGERALRYETVAQNKSFDLIEVQVLYYDVENDFETTRGPLTYYKANRDSGKIDWITDLPDNRNADEYDVEVWKEHPDLFGDFIDNGADNYSESGILPFSSDRLVTEEDLVSLSPEELILARNEPYARHGRIFKVDWIREYFEAQPWYHGTLTEEEFSSDLFSDIEMQNIMFIKEYEEKLENQ